MRDILKRRFRTAEWSNDVLTDLMADYLYHCTAQPGSGEYGMNSLLVPHFDKRFGSAIYARNPLLPRIVSSRKRSLLPAELPIKIIFGDNDWLYSKATQHALHEVLNGTTVNKNISLHIAPHAGHHIYLDNPAFVHATIDEVFNDIHY